MLRFFLLCWGGGGVQFASQGSGPISQLTGLWLRVLGLGLRVNYSIMAPKPYSNS